ncbi:hypothetical protein BJY04DRAFT_220438 [Aspergillus karnatakaensis]|uniref:uncharacterized protein n=1 Tax=Aspergillus karnatakaensis TaxID=1810916 RepID=UPI003CCD17D2
MTAVIARRAVECDFSTTADFGATCESFASSWGTTVEIIQQLNPGISCPDLDTDLLYCVIGTVTDDPPSTSSTTSTSTTSSTTTTQPPTTLTTTTRTTTTTTTTSTAPSNSPTMPGIVDNCNGFYKVSSGDNCGTIASKNGITEAQFRSWNTELNNECTNLWLDYYVCVSGPGTIPSSTSTTPQQPEPTDDPSNPAPQMPGIAENCDGFYKVSSGDGCDSIAAKHGISVTQFRSWNSDINSQCSNLWLDYYVCVHVPGATTTTTTSQAPQPTADPTKPEPQMPGIVENCDGFHKIASGDQCGTIASRYGITIDQFKSWNSDINNDCTNLWIDYYVCVHVPGASVTTTQPPTPEPTADPSKPEPQMPGIEDNCDGFHKIASGDQCGTIASRYGITLDQFRAWNSDINSDCTNLWLDYYVCVHVPGVSTTITQAPAPQPTTPNAPTPQFPGIVTYCKSFHLVKAGEGCWFIYTNAGITFEQFRAWNTQVNEQCSNLWTDYFVCIGV